MAHNSRTKNSRGLKQTAQRLLNETKREYSGDIEIPFDGYLSLACLYLSLTGGAALALKKRGVNIPESLGVKDLMLLAIGSHKLTRVIVRDWVTSPLRSPFTKFSASAGTGEVIETSRGHSFRKAVGDLLTCPWCTGTWVTTAMALGFVARPRLTRFIASALTIETVSNYLQIVYDLAKSAEKKWA